MRFPVYDAEPPALERWGTPAYAEEVRAFVEDAVGPVRLEQIKVCGWSTVWRADGGGARYWFKQNCRLNAHEARLLALLGDLLPERFAEVVAHEPESGMLLTRHHGEVFDWQEATVADWARFASEWAQVQRALLEHTDAIAATGIPVVPPDDCVEMAAERVEELAALPAGDLRRLDEASAAAARTALPAVRRARDVVAGLGLPLALNHNDLHGGNVFVGDGDGPLRFFDLGDSMLTDPAAMLLVPLKVLQHVLSCEPDDRRLWQVAEAWIEVWSDLAPTAELRAALPSSLLLALVPKHDSWLRATTSMSAEELAEWGDSPAEYLAMLAQRPILR